MTYTTANGLGRGCGRSSCVADVMDATYKHLKVFLQVAVTSSNLVSQS